MNWLQCSACRIAGITLTQEMGRAGMSALDAIRKLSADYETAHLAGDGKALARLFGDDAVIIPPGKPAIPHHTWAIMGDSQSSSGLLRESPTPTGNSNHTSHLYMSYHPLYAPSAGWSSPIARQAHSFKVERGRSPSADCASGKSCPLQPSSLRGPNQGVGLVDIGRH